MNKKKLLNPRGYLSWSALQVFEQDKEKYKRKYIYGENTDDGNEYSYFGSYIAKVLETNKTTGDEVVDMVVSSLPKYRYQEKEIRVSFNSPKGEFDLLGKMDTFEDSPHLRFRDYKTGSVKWTQKKANEHGQLKHYACLIWLKYRKLPNEVWIDYIPTKKNEDGVVQFTGESIKSFKVVITLSDILTYLARVTNVAVEIDKMYRTELDIK